MVPGLLWVWDEGGGSGSRDQRCGRIDGAQMDTIDAGSELAAGLVVGDLTVADLWVRYYALTGRHSQDDLTSYVRGEIQWRPRQHNIAVLALNEYLHDRGVEHRVNYADGF
jgi:hypothetical protein